MLYFPVIVSYFAAKQMAMFPLQCWATAAKMMCVTKQK